MVGDIHTPGTTAIRQATADIIIGDVQTKNHRILVVPDKSIPTDMLVGRDWLELPSVSYYKGKGELVIVPTVADPQLMKELPNQEEGLDISHMNVCLVDGSQCAALSWRTNQVTEEGITSDSEQCIQSTVVHEQEPITASEVHIDDSIDIGKQEELMMLINEYRDDNY